MPRDLTRLRLLIDRCLPGLNRLLTVVLILTIIGIGVLWVFERVSNTPPPDFQVPKAFSPPSETAESPELPQGELLTEALRDVFTAEELASPEGQKLVETLQSPAYETFIAGEIGSIGDYFDFFEAQGVNVDKEEILALFKASAPLGSATTLQRQMRSELSVLFREHSIEVGTNAGLNVLRDVITEFLSDDAHLSWMMTHFDGDFMKFGQWVTEVLRNPTPPGEETPTVVDSRRVPRSRRDVTDTEGGMPSLDAADMDATPHRESPDETRTENDTVSDVKRINTSVSETPELPSEERLGIALGDRFSPQRFNRALQILNQYGPQEGLRRLKNTDPEFAKQVEPLLLKRQEND
ncbi:hypothetical protein J5I95_13675 [Candidatus Poribacteria bacterium]|nr:hypothetical protein [Candidatus Poribacteria bacterium]